ncbi:hypothetical protein CHS0354_036818 [Potamilus streckersoni]|uniref:MD-2-related lipid-recognition domain-containing protein n=1 Tax=Potamilus streckersoni TaxID=2493646 RepID=A0AAE0SJA5_9BIVA|nr:hypothetical protein CHS0354_036818 [Potamilus streckersoni]
MEAVHWYRRTFIFIITCLHALRITAGEEFVNLPIDGDSNTVNMSAIQLELRSVLEETDIPNGTAEIIGALESGLHLLTCLPLHKSGNCYHPNDYCEIDVKDFTLQAKLTICKNPWTLRIDFKLPQDLKKRIPGILRPLAFINVEPIVLTLDNNNADGVTTIVSNSRIATAGLNIFGFRFNAAKAYFNFNLFVRWDCTRPFDNNMKRWQYNTAYDDGKPGNDMNKLYYKLKIDYEIKTKRFPCFCYRCKRCETIVEKQDHFAEGPEACKSG